MKKIIKNIIRGAGSAIDIAPAPKKTRITRKHTKSVSASMGRDWQVVGECIKKAMNSERKKDAAA